VERMKAEHAPGYAHVSEEKIRAVRTGIGSQERAAAGN
jgi:hypothetical protein